MAMAMADGTFDLKGTYGTMEFDPSNNSWTYTLDNNDSAVRALDENEMRTDIFTFKAGETTEDVVITVKGYNDAPTVDLNEPNPTRTVGESKFIYLSDWFGDAEDRRLSYTIDEDGLPPGMSFFLSFIHGEPTEAGIFDVEVTATDSGEKTATHTITITVNAAPDAAPSFDAFQPPADYDLSDILDTLAAANPDAL